jgi:hypothetical protein
MFTAKNYSSKTFIKALVFNRRQYEKIEKYFSSEEDLLEVLQIKEDELLFYK